MAYGEHRYPVIITPGCRIICDTKKIAPFATIQPAQRLLKLSFHFRIRLIIDQEYENRVFSGGQKSPWPGTPMTAQGFRSMSLSFPAL